MHQQKVRTVSAIITGICVLLLAGCGFGEKRTQVENEASLGSERNPIAVTTVKAESRQVPLYIDATGSFVAEESSDLAPLTSGRVTETPVDIGDYVKEGQVVARLDDSDAVLRLRQAKASVEQADAAYRQAQAKIGFSGGSFMAEDVPEVQSARASYESALADVKMAEADAKRYDSLVKTGDVSRSAYERQETQAETARSRANTEQKKYETALNNARQNYQAVASAQAMLEAANAQLALAEKAVADTVVWAPISGYITDRPIAVGEYVMPSSKIVTIVRAHPIRLRLQIPASDAGKIDTGMRVVAKVEIHGNREFEGKITALNPSIDPNSRSMMAEAKFDNLKMELRPGMFATARVILSGGAEAVMVPADAVLVDPMLDSAEVFVLEEGKARIRIVRLGAEEASQIHILSGISAGEVVATSSLEELYDGASVKVQ